MFLDSDFEASSKKLIRNSIQLWMGQQITLPSPMQSVLEAAGRH